MKNSFKSDGRKDVCTMNRPKNILKIQDLTFILPDNFDGDLRNAIVLLAAYLNVDLNNLLENIKDSPNRDPNILKENEAGDTNRLSMNYGILKLNKDGTYKLKH